MIFSKSFGYAVRGILYVALVSKKKDRVMIDEMAKKLKTPRHFLGKIMKKVAAHDILTSTKGPYGGFSINEHTLDTNILSIVKITDKDFLTDTCILKLRKCNSLKPCPMHNEFSHIKKEIMVMMEHTTIGDLLKDDKPDYIKSIMAL